MASNILSDCLKKGGDRGLITLRPYQQRLTREGYFLTEKGESLWPVLAAIIAWTQGHYPDTMLLPPAKGI
ncbi:winged helix-turn-helix transcriptional regulator [Nitrosospira sp. NpAV]|uniref:winged helix-turn-helix transcriptional regulator n=1 Tax=Nitrosospira sp. NpAV TaxID=58133 RepID=UPI0018DD6B88